MSRRLIRGFFLSITLLVASNLTFAGGKKPPLMKTGGKTGMIRGNVIEVGQRGISKGAQVVLFRGSFHDSSFVRSTSPDSLGKFEFDRLHPGMYSVAIAGSKIDGNGVPDVRVAPDSVSIVTLLVEPIGILKIPESFGRAWDGQLVPINQPDSVRRK